MVAGSLCRWSTTQVRLPSHSDVTDYLNKVNTCCLTPPSVPINCFLLEGLTCHETIFPIYMLLKSICCLFVQLNVWWMIEWMNEWIFIVVGDSPYMLKIAVLFLRICNGFGGMVDCPLHPSWCICCKIFAFCEAHTAYMAIDWQVFICSDSF